MVITIMPHELEFVYKQVESSAAKKRSCLEEHGCEKKELPGRTWLRKKRSCLEEHEECAVERLQPRGNMSCTCMRAGARARVVRVCMRACVRACVRVRACVCVRVCTSILLLVGLRIVSLARSIPATPIPAHPISLEGLQHTSVM